MNSGRDIKNYVDCAMKYQITFKNEWQNAKQIASVAFVVLTVFLIAPFFKINDAFFMTKFCLIYLLTLLIPLIAIHLNYYLINKDDVLFFDSLRGEYTFIHKQKKVIFSLFDIAKIERSISYKSKQGYQTGLKFYIPWDLYCHMVLTLNNSTKIVVTSLMIGKQDLDFFVNPEKVITKMSFFRWAKGPSIQ